MSGTGNNISQQQQQQPMAVIKRPQHDIKLANVLNNMLQCGSLVDVTIDCDGGQVNAHRLVLAASSTYFRNLFSRMMDDGMRLSFYRPIIVLKEIPVDDVKTMIEFIYHGEVNVPQNRVDSLMRCANYLQIDGMASSVNSLNAILASSSSMPHHTIMTAHPNPPVSATSNTMNTHPSATAMNKIHPQYPPVKQTRGNSSRSSSANNHTSSSNSTSDNSSNSKPKHTCPVCLKTFTHGFTLKRHMKLHSQNRITINCDVCSKSYSCKDSFLRHKKSSGHIQHEELFHHRSIDMNLGSHR